MARLSPGAPFFGYSPDRQRAIIKNRGQGVEHAHGELAAAGQCIYSHAADV